MTRPFAYASAVGTDAFRLIKIPQAAASPHETSVFTAPQVDLQIETFPFDQRPEYYALSYTWGPADPDTEETNEMILVALNGDEFFVKPNLRDALLQLRSSYPDRWFWIDAVCINQDDLEERSSQVATMDVIYSNATRTIAWIGKPGPGFARAVEIVEDFVRRTEETLPPVVFEDFVQYPDFNHLEAAGYPVLTLKDWMALQRIFNKRWFSRLWIVQEIVLSSQVDVLCGDTSVPWHSLEVLAAILIGSGVYLRALTELGHAVMKVRGMKGATVICSIKALIRSCILLHVGSNAAEQVLVDLMTRATLFECADARDRFFAVFGILKQVATAQGFDISAFRVNHRDSVSDVFCALAGDIITRCKSLQLLVWTRKARSQLKGLPSWVPDWSVLQTASLEVIFLRRTDASRSTGKGDHGIEIRGKKLWCRGLRIAAVTELMGSRHMMGDDWPPVQYSTACDLGDDPEVKALFREYLIHGLAEREELLARDDPSSLAGFLGAVDHIAATDDSGLFPSLGDVAKRRRLMAQEGLEATCGKINRLSPSDEEGKQQVVEWNDKRYRWMMETAYSLEGRQCAFLEGGYFANVPENLEVGDEIWILRGATVPFVLSRGENEGEWVNIGSAYVHGIMEDQISKNKLKRHHASREPIAAQPARARTPRAVSPIAFGVYRSPLADSIIYILALYSMTIVVILYLQILVGPAKAVLGLGIRPSLHAILDAGLWALTARPSLALAGWVVRRRIPAYATPLTSCTVYEVQDMPKRWFFELLCSLANRNHYIIPDPELCSRWVLYSLGVVGREPSSWQLGTVLPQEHEQLRVFARKFREFGDRYGERWSEGYSGPRLPPIPIGLHLIEATHYLCAEEILRHAQPRPGAEKQDNAIESYPFLRFVGDIVPAFEPLPERYFSFEEWYDLYVHPVAETGRDAKLRDNSPQECLPSA
ncbi:ankyrin and het domain protein [Colletotrichum sojae]|uniref:Ankyrin and het domain protein n=1 Tax=Colletotrichum sojae TaxID=2175907 RepID=A0A8H6MLR8_9PEZI|nr:ankyrin and het domain protein [Colletotrichum sojae]